MPSGRQPTAINAVTEWGRKIAHTKHLGDWGRSHLASAVLNRKERLMKKQALTLVGVLSLVLAAGSAFAQSSEIRFSIPFNFIVNRTTLPAGDYAVKTMGVGAQVLVIRGASTS